MLVQPDQSTAMRQHPRWLEHFSLMVKAEDFVYRAIQAGSLACVGSGKMFTWATSFAATASAVAAFVCQSPHQEPDERSRSSENLA
jgi:hypothetical protein